MTNKDLALKLNNLKNVNPDKSWLDSNRELLCAQIENSGGEELSTWKVFIINVQSFAKAASQPAFALGMFVVLIGAGLFSQQALSHTKPSDSLYIARIISEKLKLNTTFDSAQRNKLAVRFAADHARDITAVLADPEFNTEANRDQVAKLTTNFKEEVDTVKNHISRLPVESKTQVAAVAEDIVIADQSKDNKGIQVSGGAGSEPSAPAPLALTAEEPVATPAATSSEVSVAPEVSPADKALDEATKLFDQKNYSEASDKLKEVDEIIK